MHAYAHTSTHTSLAFASFLFPPSLSGGRKRPLSKNWRVALCRAVTSNTSACFDQSGNPVHLLFSSVGPSHGIGCKSLIRRHVQYHTNTQHANDTHTHTHIVTGIKLIPSILSWSQQNDLKTTFLIILSHQIKRTLGLSKKKKKKGVLPLTQKGFLKASTSAQQIQNNYDRLHELLVCH